MFHYNLYWSDPEQHSEWSLVHEKLFTEQQYYELIAECAQDVIHDLYKTKKFDEEGWPCDGEGKPFWIDKMGLEWDEILKSDIFWRKMKEKGFEHLEYMETARFRWAENIMMHEHIGQQMKDFMSKNKYGTIEDPENPLMDTLTIDGKILRGEIERIEEGNES